MGSSPSSPSGPSGPSGPSSPSSPTNPSGPSFPVGTNNYGGSTLSSSTNQNIITSPLSIYTIASSYTFAETPPNRSNISFTSLNNDIFLKKSAFVNSVNYFRANARKNIHNSSAVPWNDTISTYIVSNDAFKYHISSGTVAAVGSGTNYTYNYSYIQIPAGLPSNARIIFTSFLINKGAVVRAPQIRFLLYDSYQTTGGVTAVGNILSEVWANQKVGSQPIRWSSSIKTASANIAAGAEAAITTNDQISSYYTNMATAKNAFIAWGVDSGGGSWGIRFTVSIQYPSI